MYMNMIRARSVYMYVTIGLVVWFAHGCEQAVNTGPPRLN